jgi:uncharacterized membrane protein YhhN
MTLIPLLLIAASISGGLTILADYRSRYGLVYVFKPLAMAAIIDVAFIGYILERPLYGRLILAGLVLSLAGDVFLMLKRKRFIEGLVCFLIAHLFYGAAFLSGVALRPPVLPLLFLLAFAAVAFAVLSPHLGKMRIPVAVYILVITAMAALAANRYFQVRDAGAFLALSGAALFLVSDTSLAVNRFVRKRRLGQLLTLGTYFAAQILIAMSI